MATVVAAGAGLGRRRRGGRSARAAPVPVCARGRSASARWLREHRSLTGYLLAEFGTLQGCQQAALLLVSAIASLEAIGALRGGQVLLGPVTILQVAAISFAVPELSRRRDQLTDAELDAGGARGVGGGHAC